MSTTRTIFLKRERKTVRRQESSSEVQRGNCRFPHLVCRSVVVREALSGGLQSCFHRSTSSQALPVPASYNPGSESFGDTSTERMKRQLGPQVAFARDQVHRATSGQVSKYYVDLSSVNLSGFHRGSCGIGNYSA